MRNLTGVRWALRSLGPIVAVLALVPITSALNPMSATAAPASTPTTCQPQITGVSEFQAQATQTVTISGKCFGSSSAWTAKDSTHLLIRDLSSIPSWDGCFDGTLSGVQYSDVVGCSVSSWTNTAIVFRGYSSAYGTNGWTLTPGDVLRIYVWNPSTGTGPATELNDATSNTDVNGSAWVTCTPGTVEIDQTVTCNWQELQGSTFLNWSASPGLSPGTSKVVRQSFTASTAGTHNIYAAWTDAGEGSHSITFPISTAPNPVIGSCTAPTPVVVGSQVSCVYHPAIGRQLVGWSSKLFDPPSAQGVNSQVFTAGTTGAGSITLEWKDTSTGIISAQVSSYTIGPNTTIGSCKPPDQSTIALGATVTCKFGDKAGTTLYLWGGKMFTPTSSSSLTPSFTSLTAGKGSITLFWKDASGNIRQESFTYTISSPEGGAAVRPL